jgi:hypothetical protein
MSCGADHGEKTSGIGGVIPDEEQPVTMTIAHDRLAKISFMYSPSTINRWTDGMSFSGFSRSMNKAGIRVRNCNLSVDLDKIHISLPKPRSNTWLTQMH